MAVVCVSSSGAHAAQGSLARALLGPSSAFFTCQMGYLTLQWPASVVSADIQAHVEWLSTSAVRTRVVETEHMGHCIASSAQSRPRSATLQPASGLAPAALHSYGSYLVPIALLIELYPMALRQWYPSHQ